MRKKIVKRNFTLMEMAIVIGILALLTAIVTPFYFKHLKKARISAAKTQVKLLQQAVFDFKIDTGKTPNSLDELLKNPGDEQWDGPYLQGNIPKDPWNNEYHFIVPGSQSEFEIVSYGGDGQPGGSGEAADISSWN